MPKQLFVIEPLNLLFFIMLIFFLLSAVVIGNRLNGRTEEYRYRFVLILYSVFLAVFVLYKLLLPLDEEFMQICLENWGSFTYWNELPLNPCNIALVAVIAAMGIRKRLLFSFCFFISIVGPLLALLMPTTGFSGYSLFTVRIFGFYFTHMVLLMVPILFVKLKIYIPKYSDILPCMMMFVLMTFLVFGIDVLLRVTGLCLYANYFFCMDPDGNSVLEFFYGLIPIRPLYVLPGILMMTPLCFLIVGIYRLGSRLCNACKERMVSTK